MHARRWVSWHYVAFSLRSWESRLEGAHVLLLCRTARAPAAKPLLVNRRVVGLARFGPQDAAEARQGLLYCIHPRTADERHVMPPLVNEKPAVQGWQFAAADSAQHRLKPSPPEPRDIVDRQ